MTENTKSIGFFDWLSNTFSKPYLIFILWWIIINLDLVLILLGKYDIWLHIKTEYGGILKTKIGISFQKYPFQYIGLYTFAFPLFGTLITIIGLTPLINTIRICAVFIENIYLETIIHMQNKSMIKRNTNKYKLTKEYDEYIKKLAKLANIYDQLDEIIPNLEKLKIPSYQGAKRGNGLNNSDMLPADFSKYEDFEKELFEYTKQLVSFKEKFKALTEKDLDINRKFIIQELKSPKNNLKQ